MKLSLKKIFTIFIVVMALFLFVGCNNDKDPNKPDKPTTGFNVDNYVVNKTYEFKENLENAKALEIAKTTLEKINTHKSYSYFQTVKGVSEQEYNASGEALFDFTSDKPLINMELNGDIETGLYLKDNILYVKNNGQKEKIDVTDSLDNILKNINGMIGVVNPFDINKVKGEDVLFAGIDNDGATVMEFNVETSRVALVIHEGELRKTLYVTEDEIEYTMVYKYEAVNVIFPTDLDTYTQK